MKEFLRNLPKVDYLLTLDDVKVSLDTLPREIVIEKLRHSVNKVRQRILKMGDKTSIFSLEEECLKIFKNEIEGVSRAKLKRVINGTGIAIHTNLGRSLLSKRSIEGLETVSKHYANLEYDVENGTRGNRYNNVIDSIKYLTRAEDGIVVNNNAAAVLLVLNEMCRGKEAIISRGELVEIGGAFRIPDIMEMSGGILKEVGTTNRTHLKDYEDAISENTGAILKVHTSNYKIMGFTKEVTSKELIPLAKKSNIPIIEDLGSGLIKKIGVREVDEEKTVKDCILNGVNIVTFSGDKLLGGPQCGIIAGDKKYIEKIKKNQLNRALRVDKFTLAALEGTLKDYVLNEERNIPTINFLKMEISEIERKIDLLLEELECAKVNLKFEKIFDKSLVGGGSLPTTTLDTVALKISHKSFDENYIDKILRNNYIPIVSRVNKGYVIIDGRCIFDDDIEVIVKALREGF